MEHQTKLEIIESAKFFAAIASASGVSEDSKRQANKNIERLLGALSPEVDRILAEASGIQL